MPLVGAHISSDLGELIENATKIKDNGGNIVQLFTNKFSKKATDEYNKFGKFIKKNNMKCVVHASYTINLAQNWDYHSWWLKQFILEINIASSISAIGIVVHLGKQLNLQKEVAINNMYTSLVYVLSKIKQLNIKIFLETSSGQGSEMFYNIDDLAIFFKKIIKIDLYKDNIGICIDTCHIFSAGYDIRENGNIVNFMEYFDKVIGLSNIKLVHLNDSQNELNSKIDRHANFDNGYIGNKSMITLAKFFKKIGVPIILETPGEKLSDDLSKIIK